MDGGLRGRNVVSAVRERRAKEKTSCYEYEPDKAAPLHTVDLPDRRILTTSIGNVSTTDDCKGNKVFSNFERVGFEVGNGRHCRGAPNT